MNSSLKNEQEENSKLLMETRDLSLLAEANYLAGRIESLGAEHDLALKTYEEDMRLTDEQLAAEMENCKNLYAEHFGTTDTEVIVHVAKEAAFGDKPAKKNSTDKQG
jgi:hypothetical protein